MRKLSQFLVSLIFIILFLLISKKAIAVNPQTNPEWVVYDTTNSELPSNGISSLAIDGSGNVWIGTQTTRWTSAKGLARFDGTTWKVFNTDNSELPSNGISSLAIDDSGNVWIGTDRLVRFDGTNWKIFNTDDISCIAIDDSGYVWLGTGNGLVKFDGTDWTVYNTDNSEIPKNDCYMALEIDGNGNIWIGITTIIYGGYGLTRFNGTSWDIFNTDNSDLPDNDVYSLAIDGNGDIWVGTDSGLAKFDGISWNIYNTDNSDLPDNDVYSLAIDGSGNVWIGTLSGGLAKFDKTSWAAYNTSNSPLPHDYVCSIAIDEHGNKWIGTCGGLAVFNEDSVVSIDENNTILEYIPDDFLVYQNYPNPFNPITAIKFSLPKTEFISLKIYNLLGQEIATLVSEKLQVGSYNYFWDATGFTSGVYLYEIKAGDFVETRKMILIR